jgi:hypothetical protein
MSEENDLSAELAAAWDAAEAAENDTGEVHQSDDESYASEGAAVQHDAEVQPEGEPSGVPGGGEQEPSAAADEQPSLDTPPKGLSPEAREAWLETPEAVRQELAKREQDYEAGIVKYAQNAKRAEQMDQVLGPYQQLFAMNGGAHNTLPGLLQTASLLQMGAPQQKAAAVAALIKQFGVDIRTLDNVLVGAKPPADVQKQSELEELLNQKLGPLQEKLQTYEQREQQQQQFEQQRIQTELQQFAQSHEFYADVSQEMADLLDMSARRGRQMSLDEAYNIACSTHPSISKIMQARQSQPAAGRRQAAASSVHGTPGGTGQADSSSIRGALEAAWENAGRV